MPFERESVEHCFMNSSKLAMQTPIVSHANHSDAHRERLIGDLPSDQFGQPAEPGDALPISPSMLVPTMLTMRELNYLHYLASRVTSGRIVEIGCFLGGSTRPLIAGQQGGNSNPSKIIVYDRFIAPNQQAFDADPTLSNFGLTPDEDFLPMYRKLHADYLDSLVIKQGTIAEQFNRDIPKSMYPEQDPIALLFVDAAKSWGVHHTIANVFYPHMKPGGVLVHQDIGDFRTPWILIHMYQLRAFFEPLDRISNSPTISFRCIKAPSEEAIHDTLSKNPSTFDCSIQSEQWVSLVAYWSEIYQVDATDLLSGYRATHALHAKDPKSTIHFAEQYDRWITSGASSGHYVSPDWEKWVGLLPDYLSKQEADTSIEKRVQTLAGVHRAYSKMSTPDTVSRDWKTDAMKSHRWAQVETQLIEQNISSVILFGSGRHTRWLLGSGWPNSSIKIECIIDDHPVVDQVHGVPVQKLSAINLQPNRNRVVLPSSDAYESHLIERTKTIKALQGIPVWKVYTDTQQPHATHNQVAKSAAGQGSSKIGSKPFRLDQVELSPSHRKELGLQSERIWIDTLAGKITWPNWAQGHINEYESAFIWDIIETISKNSSAPLHAIEVGTASGVSTSVIAHGFDTLQSSNFSVDAFDILEYCYFDPTHKVGDATQEIVPHLLDRVCIHPGTNARDASKHFSPKQVHLAFIDADHRHPAAAIDLLALLPILAPNAWVILHDIELDRIQNNDPKKPGAQDGPNRLYQAWTYPKVCPIHENPRMSNIGAVQLPSDPIAVQELLINLIEE